MTIVEHVQRCVRTYPERIAVRDTERALTYRELEREADGVAGRLADAGVAPGDVVGVHMGRSAARVVALLGILRAGAAYLALDPRYPAERIRFMLADSGARVVLTEAELRADLPEETPVLPAESEPELRREPEVVVRPDDVAYLAYTSGSTGRPKGVLIPHRAVTRLVVGCDFLDIRPDDVFLHFAPIAFDASTLEIWGPLLNGGSLVVAPPGEVSTAELTAMARDAGVTVLWLTAGLFHQVVDAGLGDLTGLRYLLAGGDVLSARHVTAAVAALPGTTVVNGYGPTENTTFTCCHPVRGEVSSGAVPIGRPIRGTTVHVLDEDGRPGETGELYTGGAGLAHGYAGRPALTAERFVPDPFSGVPGARLYRTGDLVRSGEDGVLEFLGRRDDQVKVRGFRVELGEIDAALAALPEVAQHVVLVRPLPGGDKNLHAVIVLHPEADGTSPMELRRAMSATLPAYAVPALLTVVGALPLTANGKVDRAALERDLAGFRPTLASEYRAPGTHLERVVAELWADYLGVAGIGVDDDFFELGGHSLLSVQIITDLHREFGVEVSPRDFYLDPTPAGIAAALTAGVTG